jgi:hypothetical protein
LRKRGLRTEAHQVEQILAEGGDWEGMPTGWTQDSAKKFWESLTGDRKHKITKCIEKMKGDVDDPGAFCASLAREVGYEP